MRLMLGQNGKPDLLVDMQDNGKFWVVNGAWEGLMNPNDCITIYCPHGDFSLIDKHELLLADQARLAGMYEQVFDNFYNPEYVGPEPIVFDCDIDDDIPF